MASACLAQSGIKDTNSRVALASCALLLVTLWGYGALRLGFVELMSHSSQSKQQTAYIRIVQPSIPQKLKWDQNFHPETLRRYQMLTAKPGQETFDFIIWPEAALPFAAHHLSDIWQEFSQNHQENTILLTGQLIQERKENGGQTSV